MALNPLITALDLESMIALRPPSRTALQFSQVGHKSDTVTEFAKANEDRLRLVFLPAYTPQGARRETPAIAQEPIGLPTG